jgi:hypothetical protein
MNRKLGGPQNIFEEEEEEGAVACSKPVAFIYVVLKCLVLYALYLRLI